MDDMDWNPIPVVSEKIKRKKKQTKLNHQSLNFMNLVFSVYSRSLI